MLIFAIDDEPKLLCSLHKAIAEAAPEAEIMDFPNGVQALGAIDEQDLYPDIVFSDIKMPQIDGLKLATLIREKVPHSKIVFVTGYSEYSLDAYRIHAAGYVMKPVETGRIREELHHIAPMFRNLPDGLWVQCFGQFEVFWNRKPLMFGRRKTKELFAYLIDKEGCECTSEEISAELWEEENDLKAAMNRLRQLIKDLRETLSVIGQEEILVRRRGSLAIQMDMIPCDYYYMIKGDMEWVNSWYGEYMAQYSWAEMTRGRLYFR